MPIWGIVAIVVVLILIVLAAFVKVSRYFASLLPCYFYKERTDRKKQIFIKLVLD